jgi:hypothetical protein
MAIETWIADSSGIGSETSGKPTSDRKRVIAKVLRSGQDVTAVLLSLW